MKKGKMSKITVLLTGTGGFGTPSVINCLKENFENREIRVICTDIKKSILTENKSDRFYILPKGNSSEYIAKLLKICKKEKVNAIMPGSGPEIIAIAKNYKTFTKSNVFPTVSQYSSIKKLMSKFETYSILKNNKINTPEFYRVTNLQQFKKAIKLLGYPHNPICFKPSRYSDSGGSKGFRILRKNNSLNEIIFHEKPGSVEIDYDSAIKAVKEEKNLELLVMEYLPGPEYSAYILSKDGDLKYCIINLREKIQQSYSFEAKTIKNKQLFKICESIAKILELDFNSNIQIKLSKKGIPKIVEINPRIGGTIVLPAMTGVNLPYLAIKLALKEKIPKNMRVKNTKMIRYWKEMFLRKNFKYEFSN